jgi:hypothetical protein
LNWVSLLALARLAGSIRAGSFDSTPNSPGTAADPLLALERFESAEPVAVMLSTTRIVTRSFTRPARLSPSRPFIQSFRPCQCVVVTNSVRFIWGPLVFSLYKIRPPLIVVRGA